MGSLGEDLRSAVRDRLLLSARLSGDLAQRVQFQPGADIPYAWIGYSSSEGKSGAADLYLSVHIWSHKSASRAAELTEAVDQELGQPPEIAGVTMTCWQCDFVDTRLDDELALFHGIVRYRGEALPNEVDAA